MANDKISSSNLPILWNRIVSLFVAKESGKGLSSNDFTNTYKTKLDGIQEGAQKNPSTATTSANGLMSSADKKRVDSGGSVIHATCSTAGATQVKEIVLANSNAVLRDGDLLVVRFANTNSFSASTSAAITFKIGSVSYNVYQDNNTTLVDGTNTALYGYAGRTITYRVNVTNKRLHRLSKSWDIDTTYSVMKGATSSAAGTSGLVPAPAAGQENLLLRGNGTYTDIVIGTRFMNITVPDNAGNAKYLLMFDITEWCTAASETINIATRAFSGIILSTRNGGYMVNNIARITMGASYKKSNSTDRNGLDLSTDHTHYIPCVLHDIANGKYYLALRVYGSGRTIRLFGIFNGTYVGKWVNGSDTGWGMPTDWERLSNYNYSPLKNLKLSLPVINTSANYGTVGNTAVSDGAGGVTWKDVKYETVLDQVVKAGATSVTFTNAAIKDGVSIRLQSDILGVNYDYTNPPQFTSGKLVVSFPPQTKDMTVRLIVK